MIADPDAASVSHRSTNPTSATAMGVEADDDQRREAALTDEQAQRLLSRFATGDERAFDRLVAAFSPLLYSVFLRSYRLSLDDADDLCQEVLLQLTINATTIRNVRPWLLGTAINQARKRVRKLIRDRSLATMYKHDCESTVSPDLDEERDLVWRALGGQRHGDRQILTMIYVEELSYQETANRLGCPIGSVGPTRCRALARLEKSLCELDPSLSSSASRNVDSSSRAA